MVFQHFALEYEVVGDDCRLEGKGTVLRVSLDTVYFVETGNLLLKLL